MDPGDHEVVVDDQHLDHAGTSSSRSWAEVGRVAVKTAPPVVAHGHLAAAAPADQPGQRQPEAAAAPSSGGLGGEPLAEDVLRSSARRPGRCRAPSTTTAPSCRRDSTSTAACRRRGRGGRVQRVVDQVADDGGQVARERAVHLCPAGDAGSSRSATPALGWRGWPWRSAGPRPRRRRCGRSPRRTARVRLSRTAVDEARPPRRTPELDQAGDGVQLVGELVGLGAQRVGGGAAGAELALQRGPARCGRAAW